MDVRLDGAVGEPVLGCCCLACGWLTGSLTESWFVFEKKLSSALQCLGFFLKDGMEELGIKQSDADKH
jgi:hypothetical protein